MTIIDQQGAASPSDAARAGAEVQFRSVVKDYGSGARALDGVSLTLAAGEFVALLGPSGCGKTTALRSLAGLEDITSGSVLIDGVDVVRVPTNKRDLGMVFQSYSLFPHLTVLENVEFGLRMRKVRPAERRTRAEESLELVGLGHLGARYAHQLSGGQQQRVALARALVTRPRVLLLDEPLSALDAKVRVQLRDEIRRIQSELRITTLFVTHDQEEALAVADRVAVMRAGVIEQIGTPEELYSRPTSSFVAEFIGLSNRIAGELVAGGVDVLGQRLPVLGQHADRGAVTALVRPEDIVFVDTPQGGADAVVVTSSFLGPVRRTTIELRDGTLVAVQHGATERMDAGDVVRIRFAGRPVPVQPMAEH
ncbi:MAG TPA: ABC transporter ATP-binding protein [Plantibacter sp.]|uniref:ABC transporter ATP-binding protein n=1 Tax=unclassified Plantibacter TaxID=2624265 RepID=UPI002CA3A6EB|nr:ABC transporter ATP-binding protein [Plantibacter sp.]